jgi:extracellular elastinolytic metalloproteinase
MGEGWSDMMALVFKMNPDSKRTDNYPMGDYVTNSAKGIRAFPYSTDLKVNPLTYSRVKDVVARDPHSAGTVWATMLNEVYWNLVDDKGFGQLRDTKSGRGNVVFLQLMMDSLKLQPCNPDFVSARDAFIAADKASFQGANTCSMWKWFAKRGLGVGADNKYKESNAIPPECNK